MKFSRRNFLHSATLGTAALLFPSPMIIAQNAGKKLRAGVLGCGVRGTQIMERLKETGEVEIAAVCDPDSNRTAEAAKNHPTIRQVFTDPRSLIDLKDLDIVFVTTCNHWHCYAAVLAMRAGKDVYVEKPLAHNQWEGEQTVKAARQLGRICQNGVQQRSDPMQKEIKQFLYEEKGIGTPRYCRVNHFSVRLPIGKRSTPLEFPREIDKNLWLGPAADEPLYRDRVQYDWHWDWNTGNGEMGNWGVHVMDDMRNNALLDASLYPKRLMVGGARVLYDDAGTTPNIVFAYYDSGVIPVVFSMSNLQASDNPQSAGSFKGPSSGYVIYGEGGRLEGERGRAKAFDADGQLIREFKGTGGELEHVKNFLSAVRSADRTILNAEVETGHGSCSWCNMTNIAFRMGSAYKKQALDAVPDTGGIWEEVIAGHEKHLATYGTSIEKLDFHLSPMLTVDPSTGRFVEDGADAANQFMTREYRKGFEFPTF